MTFFSNLIYFACFDEKSVKILLCHWHIVSLKKLRIYREKHPFGGCIADSVKNKIGGSDTHEAAFYPQICVYCGYALGSLIYFKESIALL